MTAKQWEVSHVDQASGVLVLQTPGVYDATLTVIQTSASVPGEVELATFTLKKSGSPIALEAIAEGALPCDLHWHETTADPFGRVLIEGDKTLKVASFVRTMNPNYTVRSRGGKGHEEARAAPQRNRGGYQFASSDRADAEWFGKAGVKNATRVCGVELSFHGAATRYHLPFYYPANPRQAWIYRQHRFTLSFEVTIGEETWTSSASVDVDWGDYEFVDDLALMPDALKDALMVEYGDPSQRPPLHARDWRRHLLGHNAVSQRLLAIAGDAATLVNGRFRPAARCAVSPAEIVNTIISEGNRLRKAIAAGNDPDRVRLRGYNDIGIDSFVTRYKGNKHHEKDFTSDALKALVALPSQVEWQENEKGDMYQTFKLLNLVDAVHAVAMLYAAAKDAFADDLADPAIMGAWVTHPDELPIHLQYFWGTIYYNTGTKNGHDTLRNRGLEYHDLIWPKEDDHDKYKGLEKYNANWRTATFRLSALAFPP